MGAELELHIGSFQNGIAHGGRYQVVDGGGI
jgi:hypothetical protein